MFMPDMLMKLGTPCHSLEMSVGCFIVPSLLRTLRSYNSSVPERKKERSLVKLTHDRQKVNLESALKGDNFAHVLFMLLYNYLVYRKLYSHL